MKKHLYTVILAGVVVIVAGILLYLQYLHKKQELERDISQKNYLYLKLQDDQQKILENEGYILDPSLVLVNLKNDTISMGNLQLGKGKYLALFFSTEYCSSCVDYCLTQIKTLLLEKEIDKILLFASKYKLRDLYVFAHSNQFPDTVFYSIESLKMPIEQANEPFMFIIDEQLTVSHLFIPRKEMPEQTTHYLNIVKSVL